MENNQEQELHEVKMSRAAMYTEDELMARLRFFIGICLSFTLVGIVFVVLYSIIFVTQPLNAISPIDQKFFELIIPIATFLTGTLSGIMLSNKNPDAQMKALEAANAGWSKQPSPSAPTPTPSAPRPMGMSSGMGSMPSFAPRPGPAYPAQSYEVFELHPDDPPTRNTRND